MHESERHFSNGSLDLDVKVKTWRSEGNKPYHEFTLTAWPSDGSGTKTVTANCRRYTFRKLREALTGKPSACSKPHGCKCWAGF